MLISNLKSSFLLVAGLLPALMLGASHAAEGNPSETELLATLQSDAPLKAKVDACRMLARVGTARAVPVLATLLSDPKLSHMARYALEPLPDPSVDQALRHALGQVKGRQLVGVIGSLGVRRDAAAVKPLSRFLADADPDVAQAAARALGSIGTLEASQALRDALPRAAAANRLAFYEGLFRCAERLSAAGHKEQALAIYDQLRKADAPHQVRAGALRGAILVRGPAGLKLLRESLRADDYIVFSTAAQVAMELTIDGVTKALTDALSTSDDDRKVLILQTLGHRGDPQALPALTKAAEQGAQPVRLAAIRSLARVGDAGATPTLVRLLRDDDAAVARAANEALAALPGDRVDQAVLELARSSDTRLQQIGLELLSRRRMTRVVPELLDLATKATVSTQPAILKALGDLAEPAHLPKLLDLLANARDEAVLHAAESAVADVCGKAQPPTRCAGTVAARLDAATPAQKSALLRVLTTIGGETALAAVRQAVNDPNPEVRATAIRSLGAWRSAETAPDLLSLAQQAQDPTDRLVSLRSYLRLASHQEIPAADRLKMCRQAKPLVQRAEEKKLLLAALGNVNSPEAVRLMAEYANDAGVKQEAAVGILSVAERLLRGKNVRKVAPRLIEPLEKVIAAQPDDALVKRARALLEHARSEAAQQ